MTNKEVVCRIKNGTGQNALTFYSDGTYRIRDSHDQENLSQWMISENSDLLFKHTWNHSWIKWDHDRSEPDDVNLAARIKDAISLYYLELEMFTED